MAESPKVFEGSTLALTIFCNGSEIDRSYGIISVSVYRKANAIPYAKIVLRDGDIAKMDFPVSNTDDFKPGTKIKIDAGYGNEKDTVFQGIIVQHGLKIFGNNSSRLIIDVRDETVRMTIGRKNANFTDSKDSDIISNLIGSYSGLTADVEQTNTEFKELVQYYCSDWDYVLSRAEINGLVVIVDDGKVTAKPPQVDASPQLKVTYGEDLMEFQANMDARTQLAAVKGTTWDLKNQAIIEQTGSQPTLNDQGDISTKDLSKVIDLESYNIQTSAPTDKSGMKSWADAQLLKSGLAKIRGKMKFQGSADV